VVALFKEHMQPFFILLPTILSFIEGALLVFDLYFFEIIGFSYKNYAGK
jgi:hypothetical protein